MYVQILQVNYFHFCDVHHVFMCDIVKINLLVNLAVKEYCGFRKNSWKNHLSKQSNLCWTSWSGYIVWYKNTYYGILYWFKQAKLSNILGLKKFK